MTDSQQDGDYKDPIFEDLDNPGQVPGDPGQPVKSLSLGLTPFGHISINITEGGNVTNYIVDNPSEAWQFAGHLSALATMMIQSMYANMMAEKAAMQELLGNKKLYVPGK